MGFQKELKEINRVLIITFSIVLVILISAWA